MQFRIYFLLFATSTAHTNIVSVAADNESIVHFDIPPNVAADVIESSAGRTLLQVEKRHLDFGLP